MPGFIPDQGNVPQLIATIKQMQAQINALLVQIQFITAGGSFNLPTSDPHVVGQLWNSSGTVLVSAG